jgi:hypothetical protein
MSGILDKSPRKSRTSHRLLALSLALAGAIVVASQCFSVVPRLDNSTEVAVVNGHRITRKVFNVFARRVDAVTPAARMALLNYLVSEELFVERARELDLLEEDEQLHRLIVRRALDSFVPNVDNPPPADRDLNEFYQSHQKILIPQPVGRFQIARALMPIPPGRTRGDDNHTHHADAAVYVPDDDGTIAQLAPLFGSDEIVAAAGMASRGPFEAVAGDGTTYRLEKFSVSTPKISRFPERRAEVATAYVGDFASAALCRALIEQRRVTPVQIQTEYRRRSHDDSGCE